MEPKKTTTLLVLYEVEQLPALERYMRERPQEDASLVVALTPFVEDALKKKGIASASGRDYHPTDMKRFVVADEWVSSFVEDERWQWFRYRDVALTHLYSFSMQFYLVELLYYAEMLENVVTRHKDAARLVVFPSCKDVPPTGRVLEREQVAAVVACAKLVAARHGLIVEVPPPPAQARQSRRSFSFSAKRFAIEAGISLLNTSIGLLRRRGSPRVLASDYWRNISPIMSQLPRGELILFDRSESLNAGFGNLLRFGVRLLNFNSYPVRATAAARAEAQKIFEGKWQELRAKGIHDCAVGGVSLQPLLGEMLDVLVRDEAPIALAKIDSAYAMLERLKPDVVFLRVSVTAQTHFYILAAVARALGIPSLELQHGLEYLGPGSISKRHSAEYVALYGQVIQDEFAANGFSRERLPIVGSPRFDDYYEAARMMPLRRAGEGLEVLCVGYGVGVEWFYDDYEMEEYYRALADALGSIPHARVTIKLRPGSFREDDCRALVKRAFANSTVPYSFTQYESIPELFAKADAVFSYYSTVILEALQFGMPTIAFSAQEMEKEQIRFHLSRYAKLGALIIAETEDDIEAALHSLAHDDTVRKNLARGAHEALSQFHAFDGKASQRIVALVQSLAARAKKSK